jgi:hypothetical protein
MGTAVSVEESLDGILEKRDWLSIRQGLARIFARWGPC